MAKTKEAPKPSRQEARRDSKNKLSLLLSAMIVIDRQTKDEISYQFGRTIARLDKTKITKKNWGDIGHDVLFKEYLELEKQFKMLEIFSDKFYVILKMRWNDMLYTYNPNVSWYCD